MGFAQIFIYSTFTLLFTTTHAGITKRESEQRPMKLSWIPVVEPSELKNAQSLMIDIHPLNLRKQSTNQHFRGRPHPPPRQTSRTFINNDPDDIEEEQQQQHNSKFTSIKPFIPGTIKQIYKQSHTLNQPIRDETMEKKPRHFKQTINRPSTRPQQFAEDDEDDERDFQPRSHSQPKRVNNNKRPQQFTEDDEEDEQDFQPRSHSQTNRVNKNKRPIVEDEDESVDFRVDARHPFQGKEQKMPGEIQSKQRKDANRSRLNKQQTPPEDEETEDDEEVFKPFYMVDDPKQVGSSAHRDAEDEEDDGTVAYDDIGPLEEFDGYYDVREEEKKEGKKGKGGKGALRTSPSRNRQEEDEEEEEGESGFVEPIDPRKIREPEASFVPRERDIEFQRSANGGGSKRRDAGKRKLTGRLEPEESRNLLSTLKKIENEGYGIGIGYLSEI